VFDEAGDDGVSLELELGNGLEAAAEARRALDGFGGELPERRMRDVRLLVSELVTNAVRHAGLASGDPIRLAIDADDGALRVEVLDRGSGFEPRAPAPDPARASGWGLFLVEQLADRWGMEGADPGTRIWFEVDRPD
jgi:anti-sigma regulatory factor (Ser/Thr protein kinase)